MGGTLFGVWLFAMMRRQGQMDLIVSLSYVIMLGSIGIIMLRESLAALRAYRSGVRISARPVNRMSGYTACRSRCASASRGFTSA